MILEDASGKCIPTCLVFEMFINAFANHLIQILKSGSTWQNIVSTREIGWIIPISSDLSDTAIRFLKSCVEKVSQITIYRLKISALNSVISDIIACMFLKTKPDIANQFA